MNDDLHYLKLLSIFHYIVGGLAVLFAFFPVIYVAMGILAVCAPGSLEPEGEAVPLVIGLVFIIIGAVFVVLGWAFAFCVILAGRYLARQVHYMFCMVMGAIECIFMPFGTVLGVFTIIVLARPSVKERFERTAVSKRKVRRRTGK
jgi:hypothetical protein